LVAGAGWRQPDDYSLRGFGSRIWIGAAAAAVLLLATGIGLGRWSASTGAAPTVATAIPATANPQPASPGTAGNAVPGESHPKIASSGSAIDQSSRRTRTTPPARTGGQPEDVRVAYGTQGAPTPPSSSSAASSAYQLTAVRHLSEAEALLTSFRTRSNADQQMDAQLGSWARELLSNTRLLLDSPVTNDPQRRPLLEDLELVLVQIIQLSPGSTPQDRELIEKTLQQDHVMTRLRTAIPAGSQRGS